MRINVITSPFHPLPPDAIGAVERLFYQLAQKWVHRGHEVVFVCAGGGTDETLSCVKLPISKRRGSTIKDLVPDFFYTLKALCRMPKCDVVVFNTFWGPCLAPFFRWKYKRLVYGVHRYPRRQYFLYPFVHAYICVSTYMKNVLQTRFTWGRRTIDVIVNPVDTNAFRPYNDVERVAGRVFYAGRICREKGLLTLARAVSVLASKGVVKELVLAGTWDVAKGGGGNTFVEEMKRTAAPCPTAFLGGVSDSVALARQEAAATVFVYPSEDGVGEACPVAPMEAMATGVPVVVSTLDCFSDYAHHNETAICFKTGDVEDCVSALDRVLNVVDLSTRISTAGVSMIDNYTIDRVATRYLESFERIMRT